VSRKGNQTSFENKKQYCQHLGGPPVNRQDSISQYHVRRSDSNYHVDNISNCEQATEPNKPEQLPELQRCEFHNEYCESDKCSSVKLVKPLDNDLHSEFFKHDSEPDKHTGNEVSKSLQRQGSVQQSTTNLTLNNQNDFEHSNSSLNAIKSIKHNTGVVTETSIAWKTPQHQDHAAVIDVPHKHGSTREKDGATFVTPSKSQYITEQLILS